MKVHYEFIDPPFTPRSVEIILESGNELKSFIRLIQEGTDETSNVGVQQMGLKILDSIRKR